jgi:pimeloyl-ACP methyl ester carboxylesterase
VHGLWLPGEESLVLKHHLAQEFALELHWFRYFGASESMSDVSARLATFVRDLDAPEVHFIGHSLGGLVIYRLLERFPDLPPGRVVFLGVPCVASRAAQRAALFSPLAQLMGPTVAEELLKPQERRWTQARALGVIAGNQPIGLGQLLAHFDEDNDGTVAVSETRLAGAADHVVLPVSHLGMLVSAQVAHETGHFLTQGRFAGAL